MAAYPGSTPAAKPAGGGGANTWRASTPSHSACMPPSGSHTDMAMNVSPWYPPRQVSSRRLAGRPAERQYCRHILTATSTETEPESHRNTCSSPFGTMATSRSQSRTAESHRNTCSSPFGAIAASRSQSRTAGSWVSPPNITWLIRPS